MKVKLTIEYAGEAFSGFQRQTGQQTVQGSIEAALSTMFAGYAKKTGLDAPEECLLTGAGRTDAGVHARGQVASFSWPSQFDFDPYRVLSSINALTPRELQVLSAEERDDDFDARFTPHYKCYQYRIMLRKVEPALERHRVWQISQPLDVPAMADAAARFTGIHDFSSFRARDCSAKTTERTLRKSEIVQLDNENILFSVEGNGFMKQMIRIMTGTLVEIGAGRRRPEYIDQLFELRDRTKAGPTAPPDGLTMMWVRYEGENG